MITQVINWLIVALTSYEEKSNTISHYILEYLLLPPTQTVLHIDHPMMKPFFIRITIIIHWNESI